MARLLLYLSPRAYCEIIKISLNKRSVGFILILSDKIIAHDLSQPNRPPSSGRKISMLIIFYSSIHFFLLAKLILIVLFFSSQVPVPWSDSSAHTQDIGYTPCDSVVP